MGFAQLAGDLRHEFIGPDPDGDRQLQTLRDGLLHLRRSIAGFGLPGTMEIEVALINGGQFNDGREVIGIRKHEVREALVFVEIARQHDEAWAKFTRLGSRHRRVDTELARLIAGGGDNASSLTTDSDRAASQLGVGGLLHGREKSVRIEVQDHSASPFRKPQERDEHTLDDQFARWDEIGILWV